MDNSLRIQIILQINMTREKKKCFDYYAKHTGLDVRETDSGPRASLCMIHAIRSGSIN